MEDVHHRRDAPAGEEAPRVPAAFGLLLRLARAVSGAAPGLGERIRSSLPYPRLDPPPWTPPKGKLSESRIALVAACGVRPATVASGGGSPGAGAPRAIEREAASFEFDPYDGDGASARRDANVLFPLEHLRDLERRGAIGSCSPLHFGLPDRLPRLSTAELADPIERGLREAQVDAVLCCGCGGAGALAACLLSRALEARGFSTIAVVGPRRAVEHLRPPRAVHLPRRSRRLFGEPGERALQRDIVLFALRRLEEADHPGEVARFTRRLGPTGARGPDD